MDLELESSFSDFPLVVTGSEVPSTEADVYRASPGSI